MDHLPEQSRAPDFELATPDGLKVHLFEETRDSLVLLAFYKNSCPTCQLTFPFIQKLFAGFGPAQRPKVFGISQDDPDATRRFASEYGVEFPMLIDAHPYAVSEQYAVRYVPTLYLVGPGGVIEMADFGFSKPALRRAATDFSTVLGQPPPVVFEEPDRLPERRPG